MLGEAGVEKLLATTIAAAANMEMVETAEFKAVIVDTTVQEKAVAFPTDSRLLEVARAKLVNRMRSFDDAPQRLRAAGMLQGMRSA
ncbi:hypothetical protein WJ82_06685 [Burkholderia ubonensis]|nr:hypothetical protein WJ82_06685 [Burkholderia ubonensis]OJB39175.1 hypothetical protein BGV59_31655 [Burkholderia ubonensis]